MQKHQSHKKMGLDSFWIFQYAVDHGSTIIELAWHGWPLTQEYSTEQIQMLGWRWGITPLDMRETSPKDKQQPTIFSVVFIGFFTLLVMENY